jgi:hypothetical protein
VWRTARSRCWTRRRARSARWGERARGSAGAARRSCPVARRAGRGEIRPGGCMLTFLLMVRSAARASRTMRPGHIGPHPSRRLLRRLLRMRGEGQRWGQKPAPRRPFSSR